MAACLSVAYRPLYGAPVDPRLRGGFERQMAAFERAMALADPPIEPLELTFDGHTMPGYFASARGAMRGARRPVVILTNGYDATVVDLYLAMAQAVIERGYHCLFFDGPGQGSLLIRDGVPMVPDWERVVRVVVDAAVARTDVDPTRIALQGWSLGGFLALRATSGEPRLAAGIADPPGWSTLDYMRALAQQVGMSPAAVAALPDISEADQARMTARIEASPGLRWQVIRRGFWVNGAADLRQYLSAIAPFRLDGRAENIRCPVLVTAAQEGPLALTAQQIVDAVPGPATVLRFTTAEGAGDHCEMQNRWLANQRILDWLDDTLGPPRITDPR